MQILFWVGIMVLVLGIGILVGKCIRVGMGDD
jgi:hypothetical protein